MNELLTCGHTAHATNMRTGKPCCVICDCEEVAEKPSLEGRKARCDCGRVVDSTYDLAFFEYRGPGSHRAEDMCICGYAYIAHTPQPGRINVLATGHCTSFHAHGAYEYDSYYCGCRGWD